MPVESPSEPKTRKSIPSHIVKSKIKPIKPKKSSEKPKIERQSSCMSDSGSSINSVKNKSNLEQLKKSLDVEENKKGFLIKMNIDQRDLNRYDLASYV